MKRGCISPSTSKECAKKVVEPKPPNDNSQRTEARQRGLFCRYWSATGRISNQQSAIFTAFIPRTLLNQLARSRHSSHLEIGFFCLKCTIQVASTAVNTLNPTLYSSVGCCFHVSQFDEYFHLRLKIIERNTPRKRQHLQPFACWENSGCGHFWRTGKNAIT